MRIVYLYETSFPNRHAASLQILNTGAAFAALRPEHDFTLACGPVAGTKAAAVEAAGLSGDAADMLAAVLPPERAPRPIKRVWTGMALRRLLKTAPDAIVTRGESGLSLLPRLRRLRGRATAPALFYELHRLSFLKHAEREAGHALPVTHPVQGAAARLKAGEAAAIAAADGLICLTEGVAAAVRTVFAPERPLLVLPSGTSIPPLSTERDLDVAYAGKIERRKGVYALVDAMAALPGRTAHIAGGSDQQVTALKAYAADRQAGVHALGWLSAASVSALYARARVGVCPLPVGIDSVSDRFTSPMKLLAMMAHGMAVVATDTPPVRAIATDGVDALLVPPDDPAALKNAVAALLGDPQRAAQLGAAARQRAADFAWERRAERLEGFLSEIVSTRGNRA